MEAKDMYVGQRVLVAREEGKYVGWVLDMNRFLGKECTISEILCRERSGEIFYVIRLEDNDWAWNPESFDPVFELTSVPDEDLESILFGV